MTLEITLGIKRWSKEKKYFFIFFFCVENANDYKRLVTTRGFDVRLLQAVAFSKKLLWLAQTNVTTSKKQMHTVNAG